MTKTVRLITLVAALAVILAAGVIAQQKSDTAVDPVCGMTVTKAKAAATFDYKGTTYYFCSTGCKDAFAKEPEKYLKAAQEKAAAQPGQPGQMGHMGQMGQMGQGQMMMKHQQAPGEAMSCPMMQGGAAGGMGQGGCDCQMMGQKGMMMHGGMGGRMGMGMGRPGMMAPGMMMLFRLYGDKLEVTVENTKDGAVLKFSSKDPEVAKAIQVHLAEHMAMMKKMMEARAKAPAAAPPQKEADPACAGCPMAKK